jgi:hypothetical protein
MSSLIKQYAQRDTRLEVVPLTGYLTDNGGKNGSAPQQKPAYGAIDLTKSKNFSVDTRTLKLRNDSPISYLIRLYLTSTQPPSYYQNFEFDIFIALPIIPTLTIIEVYATEANAENAQVIGPTNRLFLFSNVYAGDYYTGTGVVTVKVLNNSLVLKSISPNLTG